ncbi:AbrB family transcriptional regulator [Corynebacterium sp. 335C]
MTPARVARVAVPWLLCAAAGLGATVANVPAGWLVGSMLMAVALTLLGGGRLGPDVRWTRPWPLRFGQVVIALLAVGPVAKSSPGELLAGLPLALLVTVVSMGAGWMSGAWLRRRAGVDSATSVMSTLPGGASLMLAMARDVGADERFVVFAQYLRLMTVSISLPVAAILLGGSSSEGTPMPWIGGPGGWLMVAGALVLARLVERFVPRFPAPYIITVLVVGVAAALLVPEAVPELPRLAVVAAYVLFGVSSGSGMTVANLRAFGRALPHVAAGIALVLGASGACGAVMWATGLTSPLDAYLAIAPGASELVFGFLAEHGGAGIVVVMHVVRVLAVALLAPAVPRLVRRMRG